MYIKETPFGNIHLLSTTVYETLFNTFFFIYKSYKNLQIFSKILKWDKEHLNNILSFNNQPLIYPTRPIFQVIKPTIYFYLWPKYTNFVIFYQTTLGQTNNI